MSANGSSSEDEAVFLVNKLRKITRDIEVWDRRLAEREYRHYQRILQKVLVDRQRQELDESIRQLDLREELRVERNMPLLMTGRKLAEPDQRVISPASGPPYPITKSATPTQRITHIGSHVVAHQLGSTETMSKPHGVENTPEGAGVGAGKAVAVGSRGPPPLTAAFPCDWFRGLRRLLGMRSEGANCSVQDSRSGPSGRYGATTSVDSPQDLPGKVLVKPKKTVEQRLPKSDIGGHNHSRYGSIKERNFDLEERRVSHDTNKRPAESESESGTSSVVKKCKMLTLDESGDSDEPPILVGRSWNQFI